MSYPAVSHDLAIERPAPGLLGAWRVHLWVIAITLVAEEVGNVDIPLGFGTVTLLPLVWGMILGAIVSLVWRRMPRAIAVTPSDQKAASAIIQVAVLIFVSKLALLVGGSVPALIASGWALVFQELGHFLGTALLGMPIVEMLERLVAFDTTSSKSNLDRIDYVRAYLDVPGVSVRRVADASGSKAALQAVIGDSGVRRPGAVWPGLVRSWRHPGGRVLVPRPRHRPRPSLGDPGQQCVRLTARAEANCRPAFSAPVLTNRKDHT